MFKDFKLIFKYSKKKTKNNSLELFFLKRFFNYLRLSFEIEALYFFC